MDGNAGADSERALRAFLRALSPARVAASAALGALPLLGLHVRGTLDADAAEALQRLVEAEGFAVTAVGDAAALRAQLACAAKPPPSAATASAPPRLLWLARADAVLAPGARAAPAVAHVRAALAARATPPLIALGERALPAALAGVFAEHRAALAGAAAAGPDSALGGGDAWDAIGGLAGTKRGLRRAVEWPAVYGSTLRRLGARASRGVLLHGPPGCGKTSLVRAAARASRARFVVLAPADVYSMFLGEAERVVRDAFASARANPPAVLFLDEIDAIAGARAARGGGGGGADVAHRVLATLLTEMDGVAQAGGVVVVAATNRLDAVDSALRRPGRFDDVLHVPLPDDAARRQVLEIHCGQVRFASDVAIAELAGATEGLSGAHIKGVCKEAGLAAAREMWERGAKGDGEGGGKGDGKVCVRRRHFAVLG